MICAVVSHAFIVASAFKLHNRQVIVVDVKELDTGEIDANENAQVPKNTSWLVNSHMNALLFDGSTTNRVV